MSNLSGSYKTSVGEVQGVDLAREQERRARLQLIEIREPSPQPIFGEPVKVESEDETSRRIKNTLGDFTQVLIHDSKSLLGIGRSSAAFSIPNCRPPPCSKRPAPNGLYKQPTAVSNKNGNVDKRPPYPRKHHESGSNGPPPPPLPPPQYYNSINRSKDTIPWERNNSINQNSQPTSSNSTVGLPVANSSSTYQTSNVPNKPYYNRNGVLSTVPAPKLSDALSSVPPPKRSVVRPSNLKLPERKPESSAECSIELETILREMKQAVPPPLTAIQTPRTEESGFAFPTHSKEEIVVKDDDIIQPFSMLQPFTLPQFSSQTLPVEPEPVLATQPQSVNQPKPQENNSSQSTTSQCVPSLLQDDLEMSDSDDDAVTEIKTTPVAFSKSPVTTTTTVVNPPAVSNSISNNMDSVPSNSSSSESSDSDSDDSSSESNDSDSSASSEASDADTPSKMWGLSNFFDETRRNHSPAFLPVETNTNSSVVAVKEEPTVAPAAAKESYSLVNNVLDKGALRKPICSPISKPIPNFLELDAPVNIKNEILSPITSPAPIIRGPRTPPSPIDPVKDENADNPNKAPSETIKIEVKSPLESLQSSTIQSKNQNISETNKLKEKDDAGKVPSKKIQRVKHKNDSSSPKNDSSRAQSHEIEILVEEPNSLKKGSDISSDKVNDITTNGVTLSTVPSDTESSHDNYSIKTRQKGSKVSSNKKSKSVNDEIANSDSVKNSMPKSPVSKFKQPARLCRNVSEKKKVSDSTKSTITSQKKDSDEIKKPVSKSDQKVDKTKVVTKSNGTSKSLSKNTAKSKNPKVVSKTPDAKKEAKRKKNKFHIHNFLQSPTISSQSGQLSKTSHTSSPSHEKSIAPESKASVQHNSRRSSVSSRENRSPSRSSSKSSDRGKINEKLRRSARCSERTSSIAQNESIVEDSDQTKKNVKRTPKSKEHAEIPRIEIPSVHMTVISPIPHNSPVPSTSSESAISTKIMVCIPLDKLTRLPAPLLPQEVVIKPASKNKLPQQNVDSSQKKDTITTDKSKTIGTKRSLPKDIKDKHRTDSSKISKTSSASGNIHKKDKLKTSNDCASKSNSSVNSKSSIKPTNKSQNEVSETELSKKRKSDDDKPVKKKPKLSTDTNLEKGQTILKSESNNENESANKLKSLERCDSVSSLSSLSSQVSQRSLKVKEKKTSDSKKIKSSSCLWKPIKQEKEEKPKATIKVEPGTTDKSKDKSRENSKEKDAKSLLEPLWKDDVLSTSSQNFCTFPWDDPCKTETKGLISTSLLEVSGFDWDHFGSEIKNLKDPSNINKHNNQPIMPMDYYWTEGKKQRHLAEKEKDPFLQTVKYFEATVLFILTSQQREEYTKHPETVYKFYQETLDFSNIILQNVQNSTKYSQGSPGSTEFKLLILCLRCQSLLHVKLYNLKIKEIKEQLKNVSDFFLMNCPNTVRNFRHQVLQNPRLSLTNVPSPHSPTPSPASSVNSQTSGYCSGDVGVNHTRNSHSILPQSVNVTQHMLDMICRQHAHLINLHLGHDLWEQADMYMTRSNLREFFKEVADQSENLTLHSSIKDLVNYVQTGISLVKKCCR